MSQWRLSAVTDGLINFLMKFGEDLISKSWDTGPQTLGPKKFCIQKFGCKRIWGQQIFLLEKDFGLEKIVGQKKVSCPKVLWPEQMLHGQMSPWRLSADTNGLIKLLMKFCKDLISKSWDTGPQTLRWSGGRSACRPVLDRKYNHFVAPSCKMKLARFSA